MFIMLHFDLLNGLKRTMRSAVSRKSEKDSCFFIISETESGILRHLLFSL